ncbi:MAG: hypothetical protein ACRDRR_01990 [Pseudonocardiaceae bacterium]
MIDKEFIIKGYPRCPVQAGTTVRLKALLDGQQDRLNTDFEIDWDVVGPRSDDVDQFLDQGPNLDFAPPLPGAYTVTATRKPKQTTSASPRLAAAGADPGDAPGLAGFEGSAGDGRGQASGASVGDPSGGTQVLAEISRPGKGTGNMTTDPWEITAEANVVNQQGNVPVSLQRTQVVGTPDQVLWTLIRNRTLAIGFRRYKEFIDAVLTRGIDVRNQNGTNQALNFTGTQAYQVLKQATDAFLMQECGVIDAAGNCVKPVGFLDPSLMETELASDSAEARAFLEPEARRYARTTAVTLQELQSLREQYYQQLALDGVVTLPYLKIIRERLSDIPIKIPGETTDNCYGILRSRLTGPLTMELIWSYWHEEGMLVQTLNAILARFQNRRLAEDRDPLARFDLDPLRPLANLFWGWAEDEVHRLTVRRRAFEYDHEYGLTLIGRAVTDRRTTESRSKFVESFHTLLHLCHLFFKEDDDTTMIADGFGLLNGLRETHLILSEGAGNQFGDLPSASRAEMLIMQWLLARPELRDFLGGRVMVPYEEEWMDRVDSMKQIQGWSDTTVTHSRDMGVFGEQILLTIRYGNWSVINDPQQAANWARYWRPEIQRYNHAYRAATGVDLTERVDTTVPAHLLKRRLAQQHRATR